MLCCYHTLSQLKHKVSPTQSLFREFLLSSIVFVIGNQDFWQQWGWRNGMFYLFRYWSYLFIWLFIWCSLKFWTGLLSSQEPFTQRSCVIRSRTLTQLKSSLFGNHCDIRNSANIAPLEQGCALKTSAAHTFPSHYTRKHMGVLPRARTFSPTANMSHHSAVPSLPRWSLEAYTYPWIPVLLTCFIEWPCYFLGTLLVSFRDIKLNRFRRDILQVTSHPEEGSIEKGQTAAAGTTQLLGGALN